MLRKAVLFAVPSASLVACAVALAAGPFDAPDVVGTDQPEALQGTINSERIFALGGDDTIHAGPGSDWADGGAGKDTIYGESGNDLITGETCNKDRCDPPESDVLHGGSGDDVIKSNMCREDVYPNECPDGRADDHLYGEDGNDRLYLNAPGRTIADGGNGDDRIYGSSGADTIVGGTGRDYVSAGAGNDHINVRDGEADDVFCGPGHDTVRRDAKDRLHSCEVATPKIHKHHSRRR
jgi:Ca2+-binding RTX toxin-like protein